mmetsp:Transcript_8800/g.18897  ORF Transcript_8800/g.18897 Transcript_8800/m.18897 type:complete len:122 (-) Transcript_8800:324-689(-)
MSFLQLAHKSMSAPVSNPVTQLYRSINKELPRVLVLYDLDMPLPEARKAVRAHFDRYAHIKDERVEKMLVAKGYIDLEETLLQHKQRSHLQRTLSGYIDLEGAGRKRLAPDSSIDDQFARA